jgi:hypothetical protein
MGESRNDKYIQIKSLRLGKNLTPKIVHVKIKSRSSKHKGGFFHEYCKAETEA